jgi:hypothetical protein
MILFKLKSISQSGCLSKAGIHYVLIQITWDINIMN